MWCMFGLLFRLLGGRREGGRGGGLIVDWLNIWCSPGVTFFPNYMRRCYVVGCLVQMALLLFFGQGFFFCPFAPLALSATVGARHQTKSINSTQLVRWRPASVRVALLCCSVDGAVSGFHHRTGSKSHVCVFVYGAAPA